MQFTGRTPIGSITFKDGSTTLGTRSLGQGSGSYVISTLRAGSHSLTAVYAGNVNFSTSTSSTLTQTVNKAGSTTTLASGTNPSTYGNSTTLTATISPSAGTGTITFKDGSTTIGTASIGHGSGSLAINSLSVGSHNLTAVYGGNTNYLTSTSSTVTQTVNTASTTTVITSSLNPSTYGSGVTLIATVTPSTATGTITFKDGSTTLGTRTLGHGSGSYTTLILTVGNHSLTAVYSGHGNYATSTSSTLTQAVTLSYPVTLINGPSWSTDVPSALSATGSVTFNGTNQYGSASDTSLPTGSGSFTVSWWQKTSNSAGSDFYAWSWGSGGGTAILGGMYQNKLFGYNAAGALIQSAASVNDNTWHHGALTYNGTTLRLYLDGTQVATTAVTLGTNSNGRFQIARSIGAGNYWPGSLTSILIYSAALSAGDVMTLTGGGNPSATPLRRYNFSEGAGAMLADSGASPTPTPPPPQVICDGNSLTLGVGGTSYPTQLLALLGGSSAWTMYNFGVGGQTTEDMNSDVSTQVDSLYNPFRPKNIVVAWDGINSINNANDTAAQAYAAMTTYIQGRQAAGFKVIVLTAMKWGTITPDKETIRQAYNALVLANSAGADAVVDVASDSHLTDPTNATYFNGDTVHLTSAGYAIVAGLVEPAVLAQ